MKVTNNQVVKEISTHKAVKENGAINIYTKGLDFEGLHTDDELIYTIPLEDEDDLFAIFERLEENNRINRNEFATFQTHERI